MLRVCCGVFPRAHPQPPSSALLKLDIAALAATALPTHA